MNVQLLTPNTYGRLEEFKWDPNPYNEADVKDEVTGNDPFESNGMVTFTRIPVAKTNDLTIRFLVGADLRNDIIRVEHSARNRDIETFGTDLGLGPTWGSFGADDGGATPVVRMCVASEASMDAAPVDVEEGSVDRCATYGYQWTTGSLTGLVETRSRDPVMGLSTELKAAVGGHNTDSYEAKKTDEDGKVSFGTSLQDGDYDVTVTGDDDYTVPAPTGTQEIGLYHDEEQWVKWYEDRDTDADDDDKVKDDGGDKAEAEWTVERRGGVIMGFVGNDDGDNRLRGQEAVEDVEITIKGGDAEETVSTDRNGFYKVTGLPELEEGDYTVTAMPKTDCCKAVHRTLDDDELQETTAVTVKNNQLGSMDDVLLTTKHEGKFLLPGVDIKDRGAATRNTGFKAHSIKVDNSDVDVEFNTVNFALVYTDGEFSGSVMDLGGNSDGIDVRVYECKTASDDAKTCERGDLKSDDAYVTAGGGYFAKSGLEEGGYLAVIEDRNWSAPKMNAVDKADDDAEGDKLFPDSVIIFLEGPRDAETFDPLVVYSSSPAMTMDELEDAAKVEITAKWQGAGPATYAKDSTYATAWIRNNVANPDATGTDSTITVVYGSKVTFGFHEDEDADYEIRSAQRDDDEGKCAGNVCTLDATSVGEEGGDGAVTEDTLRVTVTAANGYNDHIYSIRVSQQGPVGWVLAKESVTHGAGDATAVEGGGTLQSPWVAPVSPDDTDKKAKVSVELKMYGGTGTANLKCTQTLKVYAYPKGSSSTEVTRAATQFGDVCRGRYDLAPAGTSPKFYELHMTAEDGKSSHVYYLRVDPVPS